jgi:hypothetical protein
VPADLLDAIRFYRTTIDVNVHSWHKADIERISCYILAYVTVLSVGSVMISRFNISI